MKKNLKCGKICLLFVFCAMMTVLFGCSREYSIRPSLVAGINEKYKVSLDDDGSLDILEQTDNAYCLDDWRNMDSISFGIANIGGIRNDGSVIVTGDNSTGACEVQDWRNIKDIAFTAFMTYGLKNNGTIIHTGGDLNGITDFERQIFSGTDKWRDIVDISGAQFILAGIKKDGSIVVSVPTNPEMEEGVKGWRNVKDISVSMTMILGVTWSGEVLCVYDDFTNEWSDETVLSQYQDLKGAEKVYAGQTFVAGLMQDGTLKIRIVESGYQDKTNLIALDGMTDIKDASNYEEYLAILKNDGSVLTAGNIE